MDEKRSGIGAIGLALALSSCGAHADPWVGTYDATKITSAVDCTTGVPLAGSPTTTTGVVDLMRSSDDRLFTAGVCPIFFREVSAAYAELSPGECDSSLADGTAVHVMLTSGRLELAGDRLTGEYDTRTMTPTQCVTSRTTIDGTRL